MGLIFRILFIVSSVFIGSTLFSCGGGSDDDGGTTGGTIETPQETSNTTDTADTSDTSDTSTNTSSTIKLDAFDDFNCSSGWGNRDGALGRIAYSGSGSCSATFKGTSGTYRITLSIRTEYDGESPYRVSINGTTIKEGNYPLSTALGCDCPHDDWRSVCPDRDRTVDLGTRTVNTGAKITFWGSDTYPCGEDHGAYAKWHGMTFVRTL